MKLPANPVLSRLQLRRLAYLAMLLVSLLATLFLLRVHGQRDISAYDSAVRTAWQTEASPVTGAMAIAAVRARFNISGGSGAGDLVWQVTNESELRASLSALELATVKLREVKITRRGAGFAVTAEQIQ